MRYWIPNDPINPTELIEVHLSFFRHPIRWWREAKPGAVNLATTYEKAAEARYLAEHPGEHLAPRKLAQPNKKGKP